MRTNLLLLLFITLGTVSCVKEEALPSSSDSGKLTKKDEPTNTYEGEVVAPTNEDYSQYIRLDNAQKYRLYPDKLTWESDDGFTVTANLIDTVENKQHFRQSSGKLMIISHLDNAHLRMDVGSSTYHLKKEGINTASLIGRVKQLSSTGHLVNEKSAHLVKNTVEDKKVCLTHPHTGDVVEAEIDEAGRWKADNLDTKVKYNVAVGKECASSSLLGAVEPPIISTSYSPSSASNDMGNLAITNSYSFKTTFTPRDKYVFASATGLQYFGDLYIENISDHPTSETTFEISAPASSSNIVEFSLTSENRTIGSLQPHTTFGPIPVQFTVNPFIEKKRVVGLKVLISGSIIDEEADTSEDVTWEDVNYFTVWGSKFKLNITSGQTLGNSDGVVVGILIAQDQDLIPINIPAGQSESITIPCNPGFTYTLTLACTDHQYEAKYALGIDVPALGDGENLDTFNEIRADETASDNDDNNTTENSVNIAFGENRMGYLSDLDFYQFTCAEENMGVQLKLTGVEIESEGVTDVDADSPLGEWLAGSQITGDLVKFQVTNFGTSDSTFMTGKLTHNSRAGLNIEYAGSGGGDWNGLDMKFGEIPNDHSPRCGYAGRTQFGACDETFDQYTRISRTENFQEEYEDVTYNLELVDAAGFRYILQDPNESEDSEGLTLDVLIDAEEQPLIFNKEAPIPEIISTETSQRFDLLSWGEKITITVLPHRTIGEIFAGELISIDEIMLLTADGLQPVESDDYFIPGRTYMILAYAYASIGVRGQPVNPDDALGFLRDGENAIRTGNRTVRDFLAAVRTLTGMTVYRITRTWHGFIYDSLSAADDENLNTELEDGYPHFVHASGSNSMTTPTYEFPGAWPEDIVVTLDVDQNDKVQEEILTTYSSPELDSPIDFRFGDMDLLKFATTSAGLWCRGFSVNWRNLYGCVYDYLHGPSSEDELYKARRMAIYGSPGLLDVEFKDEITRRINLLSDLAIFEINGDKKVDVQEVHYFWWYITRESTTYSDTDTFFPESVYPDATRRTIGEIEAYIQNVIERYNIDISNILAE